MRVVPWLWICSSMAARAPLPSAIIAITEATPMITPSMVSTERTLFLRMALNAMRRVSRIAMLDLRFQGQRLHFFGRVAPLRHRLVRGDAAVADVHGPRAVLRDVVLVGDEDDGQG